MHLIKRSDSDFDKELDGCDNKEFTNQGHYRLAKVMLNELLHRCPLVAAPHFGYKSPLINVLFRARYKAIHYSSLTRQCIRYSYHLLKLIIDTQCDLNDTDHNGNTILHIVISDVFQEIECVHKSDQDNVGKQLSDVVVELVQLLLENGSYPHAKNKQGKCPVNGLQDIKPMRYNPENLFISLNDLLEKYGAFTLQYLSATKIVQAKISYKSKLPEALVKFVDLH